MANHTVHVALLRGINVGGHTKVAMVDLRRVVESTGCTDVRTYIQSGNVVFRCPPAGDAVGDRLEDALADQLGVRPAVMIRSADEIAAVTAGTPYPDAAEGTVHVGFLQQPPPAESADVLAGLATDEETLRLQGRELYLHLPGGVGRSRLMVEVGKRLTQPMTVRNWRTVTKLAQMCAEH